jgi:hypothetical protein
MKITADELLMLKKQRRDIKRFVTDTRTNVIMNMGLPDTPLTKKEQSQLLTKTDEQIKEDINKRIQKNLDLKNNSKKRRVIDDEAEEDAEKDKDNIDQDQMSIESPMVTPSAPAKYSSSRCKFFFSFFVLSVFTLII